MSTRAVGRIVALALLGGRLEAQAWSLSPRPVLQIGSETSSEYQFNRIEFLKRMEDGRILVTMGPAIRFFDASGKFVGKAGGRGSGPGEFQWISDLIVLPGDTLHTMNVRTIVVLDKFGKFVRQSQTARAPLQADGWYSEDSFLLPNGNLLAPQYAKETPGVRTTTLYRPEMRYSLLHLGVGEVTPLLTGGGLAQLTVNGRGMVQPFTPLMQHAIGQDRMYVGDNDSPVVRAFTLDGKPVGVITVADKPTPVTAADLAAAKEEYLDGATMRKQPLQQAEQLWAGTPMPKRYPYWGTMLVDRRGVLWVSSPQKNKTSPMSWTAYDRAGKRLTALTMPAGFKPRDIGTDYVLGIQLDDVGVETIRMYSLKRP